MRDLLEIWYREDVPIVVRSTVTSPFGRKVWMAADVLGLAERIDRVDADTRDETDSLRQQNPLGKMPCLLIGEEAIYDSSVIIELLDAVAGGGRLIPRAGMDRFLALTRVRLADGIADAGLLMVYEDRFREEGAPVAKRWLAHQRGKVTRALASFEADPPDADRLDAVSISLGAALGYLDWRKPVEWRADHPRLTLWLAAFDDATTTFFRTERTA